MNYFLVATHLGAAVGGAVLARLYYNKAVSIGNGVLTAFEHDVVSAKAYVAALPGKLKAGAVGVIGKL